MPAIGVVDVVDFVKDDAGQVRLDIQFEIEGCYAIGLLARRRGSKEGIHQDFRRHDEHLSVGVDFNVACQ